MVAKGCKGTNRRRPAVREIPSAVRSSEKEQSSLCEVATIEDADRVLLTTFFMLRFELLFRNLNLRIAPLERSHCSFRLTRSPHFGFADSPLG